MPTPTAAARPSAPRPPAGWGAVVVALGVMAALALGGLAAPGRPFLLDDRVHLGVQPDANAGRGVVELMRLAHWQFIDGDALWRPLSKMVWTALGGGDHAGWPLALLSVVLAGATAGLLALALGRAMALRGAATAVAVVAAWPMLHPAALDVLVPYVGQSDLMAALGVVAAWVCFQRATAPALAVGGGGLLLALLAKESAAPAVVALPVMVLAGPGTRRRRWRAAAGVAAAAVMALAVWVGLRLLVVGAGASAMGYGGSWYAPGDRVVPTLEILGRYAAMAVNPLAIPQVDYSFLKQPGAHAGAWPFLGALVLTSGLAAVVALGWRRPARRANALALRRRRLAAAGLVWTVVFLLPYVHLVPIGALMAGRFLYLPLMGVAIAGGAWVAGRGHVARGATMILVGAWAVCFVVVLHGRVGEWRDAVALFTAEVARVPEHAFAWRSLAAAQQAAGDPEAALLSAREATRLWPSFAEGWLVHAQVARANRRRDEALAALDQARRLLGADHPEVRAEEDLWRRIDAGNHAIRGASEEPLP